MKKREPVPGTEKKNIRFEHFSANRYLVYIKRPLFEAISVRIKHRRPCTQLISRSVNQDSTCQKGKKGPQ